MERTDREAKLRLGGIVFWVLILLEVVEYLVGTGLKHGSLLPLAVLAVAASWPIVRYYMHIHQIFDRGPGPSGPAERGAG